MAGAEMKTITFAPKHVAERIYGEFDLTISIMPPGEQANLGGDVLRLCFDDTETPCAGLEMFSLPMAQALISAAQGGAQKLLVHCEAGMSRSAAVARWLSDNMDYDLWLHPDGVGTDKFYNRHVYRTLDAAHGQDLAAYYSEMERLDRMMGL